MRLLCGGSNSLPKKCRASQESSVLEETQAAVPLDPSPGEREWDKPAEDRSIFEEQNCQGGLVSWSPLFYCRILHTLRVRYALDMIYTYSGGILIAVSLHSPSLPAPLPLLPAQAM